MRGLSLVLFASLGCNSGSTDMERLSALVLRGEQRPPDLTNALADDARAADLGQQLFFDTRFSGPLLDEANTGIPPTLGDRGDVGRVSCASCHVPDGGRFVDTRTPRNQISLAAGWTRRRTPPLLDLAQVSLLTWDGHRDTAFSIVFGVIESPVELNSSRLYVAQQLTAFYREPYEAIFGAMPSLAYGTIAAADAGCRGLPSDPYTHVCTKPGHDDPAVDRVIANMGKALDAYMRQLSCGRSRFDAWMEGDADALDAREQAGAHLFVRLGCDSCHSGPYLTDQRFHNVGVPGRLFPFSGVDTRTDRGAIDGLASVLASDLSSRGPYSDGDDGRLDAIPDDLSALEGAFRTPSLRCLGDREGFMHDGWYRNLYDVIRHFESGGSPDALGTSEIEPFSLTDEERESLRAFLLALDGPGADPSLRVAPALP